MAKAARATISDVAKAAKTGKTSISRYLNGEKHLLSDDLLARIEKAIAELNYRPSLMARGLKHGRTRLIGLIIADITNPYSVNVLSGIEAACRVHQMPVTLTFDMGNWLWVGDSPEEAARHLAPAVSYIHVKAAEPHHEKYRAVPPDQADARWLALLDNLPADAPRGIEFPLVGDDLTAVTRHYVDLLRED